MAYRDVILADAPVAYWRLGEASGTVAADEVGAHPGTYVGGALLGQPGVLAGDANKAVSFDGVDDKVSIPSNAAFDLRTGRTVEAWVRADVLTRKQTLVARSSSAGPYHWGLSILSNGQFEWWGGASLFAGAASTAVQHVVGTWDGATMRLYVNGVQAGSVANTAAPATAAQAVTLGAEGNQNFFDGLLDEVAIYNYALSPTQVAAHYEAGTSAPADTTPPAVPSGLAATPGDAQVALSWTANTEGDLAGYRLYRDGVQVYDGAAATFTDTTVTNGTAYSYTVSAYDTAGNESAKSTAVQATPTAPADTTPPAVPAGLTAAPGDAQVSLDWSDNVEGDLAGYRLYRDGAQIYDGAASTYLDSTAVNGTTYSYAVSAYDTAGNASAQSAAVQATPAAPPPPDPPPPAPDPPPSTPDPKPAAPRVKRPVPNWTLLLDDHTSTEVAELAVIPTMRWEIRKATSVTFALDQHTEAARELAAALANGIPQLRAYRDGVLRARGHWYPQQDTADAEQATAQCTFRGPLARPETRHLRAALTRTQIDQGQILLDALAATNAIAATGLAAGTLTPSKLRDRTYEAGKQLAELLAQMGEVIDGCEFMERPVDNNPAILAALDIAGALGQDRSDEVRFELGVDTLSNLLGFDREIILPVNYARVTGKEGDSTTPGPAPQIAQDQASIAKWGLYETALALSDVTQASTLLERAQALIRPDPGRTVTLTPDPTQAPQPWIEWWLGDTVGYLVDEGALDDAGTARPVALEITLDESGNETSWKVEWGEQLPSWPDGVIAALRRRLGALER